MDMHTFRSLWCINIFNSLRVYCKFMTRYWRWIIKNQLKQLFLMINNVTQSRVVSNVSRNFSEKCLEWVSWMCVWHHISVCVQQIAQRSCLTFPLTALNFSQCQDCQRQRAREGGEVGRGRGKTASEGGDGVSSLRAETAYVLVRFGTVTFLPVLPIITWWCLMKVRPVCGLKPYQRLHTANHTDSVLVRGLKHHPTFTWPSVSRVSHLTACFVCLAVCMTTMFSNFKGWKIWKQISNGHKCCIAPE